MLNLIEQYNNLSDEEKKDLLIYKSDLGLFINQLSSIKNVLDLPSALIFESLPDSTKFYKEYVIYKKVVESDENAFIRKSIFNNIDFTSIYSFISDLRDVYGSLMELEGKISLDEDITLYRGSKVRNDSDPFKSSLISTSINVDNCNQFLNYGKDNQLEVINVKKGTSVLVIPYRIISTLSSKQDLLNYFKNNERLNTLKVVKNDSQEEVILFKDSLNILAKNSKDVTRNNETIKVMKIDTEPLVKENEIKR